MKKKNKNLFTAFLLILLIIFVFLFTLYNMGNGILIRPL